MQVNFFVGSSGLAQLVRIAKYVQPTIFHVLHVLMHVTAIATGARAMRPSSRQRREASVLLSYSIYLPLVLDYVMHSIIQSG